MPQETKSHPSPVDEPDLAPAARHENLEGHVPPLATDDDLRAALEKAFDYRGDVTVTRKDGTTVEGYVFDRHSTSPSLKDCYVRLYPKDSSDKLKILYSDIAALAFTGRDTAAGKSWETWVKKYNEKKSRGETNIRLDPEKLD